MNIPHKNAEVIKAWADGKVIQFRTGPISRIWHEFKNEGAGPWDDNRPQGVLWRVKPETVKGWVNVYSNGMIGGAIYHTKSAADDTQLTHSTRIACFEVTYTPGEGMDA